MLNGSTGTKTGPSGLNILYEPNTDKNAPPAVDIIAIPDFDQHQQSEATWAITDPETKEEIMWLKDLLPSHVHDIRVFSYCYSLPDSGFLIAEVAQDLLQRINSNRETDEDVQRPLVFITHGLGAVIVKEALKLANFSNEHFLVAARTRVLITFDSLQSRSRDMFERLFRLNGGKMSDEEIFSIAARLLKEMREISNRFSLLAERYETVTFYADPNVNGGHSTYKGHSPGSGNPPRIPSRTRKGTPETICKFLNREDPDLKLIGKLIRTVARRRRPEDDRMDGYKYCLDVLSKLCPDWTPIETPTYEPELFSWVLENKDYILFLTDERNQVLHLRGSSRLGTGGMLAFLASNVRTSANKPIVVSCSIDARTQDHYHATWVVSLVYQLLCQIPWAYAHVRRFTDAFVGDSSSSIILRSVWTIFRALLATPNRREIIITIDAECADLAADALLRENVWKLEELTDRDLSWRMIVARQDYPPGFALRELALLKLNMDAVKAVDEKIEASIKTAASQLVRSSLYRNFEKEVYRALHGQKPTLVTVDLKVQFLSGLRVRCTPASIREELNGLAHCDLMGVYGRIMDTILERDRDWSKKVISWLLFAIRSMTPDELAVALSVNQDTSTTCASAEQDTAVNMLPDLLRVFSSLVRTDNGVICEVHPSFREFIISSPGKWYSFDGPSVEAQHASHTLTCLIYLCADDVFDSAEMSPAQRGFRNYAARYWSEHYRYSIHTTEEVSQNLRTQVQLFFESKRRNLRKWCSLKRHLENPQSVHERCTCTRVDLAAELGLADVVVGLLKDIADREAPFDDGASISSRASFGDVKKTRALKIAAENGNSKAVEAILKYAERDGVIGSVDIGLALKSAARSGYDEIVRILLATAKGIQIPETADFLRTALVEAAGQGYQSVVAQLLEANAKVNLQPVAVGRVKEDSEEGEEPNGEEEGLTPLHIASQNGHDDIVEQLLAVGAKVSGFPERQATPLHMAAQHGQLMSVEKFLKTNAELNARDATGSTAIHLACANGFLTVVEALLDATSSVIGKDDRGRTLLHLAAAEGHDDIIEMLLKPSQWNVGDIDSLDYRDETPLHLAASGGHMAVVEKFFHPENNNDATETAMGTANSDGHTPFHFAAKEGHLNVVDILLDNAADPEAQNSTGERPLHLAARNGHRDVVTRLLEVDCYPHVTTESGYTALHLAAEHGDMGVVEELLDATVSQDAESKDGAIALHLASQNGHTDVVKRLLDEGSSEDAVTESGATPLHFASENGHVNVVRTLIAARAPIDDERNDGCTALHLACENSHSNIVDMLIKAGANINSKNSAGWTPLHAAYGAKSAELLIAAGADVNALTDDQDTPLFLFAASGDTESMQLLYDSGTKLCLHETADDGTDGCLAHSAEVGAAEFGHLGALKLLIQWGVDPFEGDNCKPVRCTPLSKALDADSNEVIEFLLQHVVNHPERLAEVIFTLIFHCALSGLLHLGETVNLNQKDEHGRTPLFYAAAGGNENIVKLLLSAGLETNLPDNEGRVALDVAMKPRIRQLLLEGPNVDVDDDANHPTDDEALAAICSCGYLISGDPGNLYRWSTLECLACGENFVGFHYHCCSCEGAGYCASCYDKGDLDDCSHASDLKIWYIQDGMVSISEYSPWVKTLKLPNFNSAKVD